MSSALCLAYDPRVGVRLTKPTDTNPHGTLMRGIPRCRRPEGHPPNRHHGDGWIWNATESRGDTRLRRVQRTMSR